MKPLPTRYRVVEEGRRLVVIDALTGAAVSEHPDGGVSAPLPARRGPAGVDDGSVFTTRAWYDDKAPRTVRLNQAMRQRIKNIRFAIAMVAAFCVALSFLLWPFFPILLIALLVQPKLHKRARGAVTRWIDGFDQAA